MTEMLPCKHFLHCFLAHLLFKKNNNNWHQTLGQKVNNNKNQTNKYRKINSSIQKTTHADTMQQHTAGNSLLFCNERNKHKLPNTNKLKSQHILKKVLPEQVFLFLFFLQESSSNFSVLFKAAKITSDVWRNSVGIPLGGRRSKTGCPCTFCNGTLQRETGTCTLTSSKSKPNPRKTNKEKSSKKIQAKCKNSK